MYQIQWVLHAPGTVVTTCTRYSGYYMYQVQWLLHVPGTVVTTCTKYSGYYMYQVQWVLHVPGTMVLHVPGTVGTTCTRYSGYYMYQVQWVLHVPGTVGTTCTRYSMLYMYQVQWLIHEPGKAVQWLLHWTLRYISYIALCMTLLQHVSYNLLPFSWIHFTGKTVKFFETGCISRWTLTRWSLWLGTWTWWCPPASPTRRAHPARSPKYFITQSAKAKIAKISN